VNKENRNAISVTSPEIEKKIREASCNLDQSSEEIERLDRELGDLLSSDAAWQDDRARELVERVPTRTQEPEGFAAARKCIADAMELVAQRLSDMWTDERYVRASLDDEFLSEVSANAQETYRDDA
jgi:hypothetical protein